MRCSEATPDWTAGVPTFHYRCGSCRVVFEVQQHYGEPPLTVSPCGGRCTRVIAPAQWSPRATPSSYNSIPPRPPNNAWERGELVGERNMPLLDGNLQPIPIKDLSHRRHEIEDGLRRLRTDPNVFAEAR